MGESEKGTDKLPGIFSAETSTQKNAPHFAVRGGLSGYAIVPALSRGITAC